MSSFLRLRHYACRVAFGAAALQAFAAATKTPAELAMEEAIKAQKQSIQKQRESVRQQPGADKILADFAKFLPIAPLRYANCAPLPQAQIDALIAGAARQKSVPAVLIRAVMKQESGFRPCAVSVKGAQGLMQLMPATAQEFHVTDPFDVRQNVEAGAAFLAQLLAKYKGDVRLALGAYNSGPARVDSVNGIPDIPETRAYVDDIVHQLAPDSIRYR